MGKRLFTFCKGLGLFFLSAFTKEFATLSYMNMSSLLTASYKFDQEVFVSGLSLDAFWLPLCLAALRTSKALHWPALSGIFVRPLSMSIQVSIFC